MLRFLLVISLSFFSQIAFSQLQINNVSESALDDLVKELGATFRHNGLSSARTVHYGKGFELGMIAGKVHADQVAELLSESGNDSLYRTLPQFFVFVGYSLNDDLAFESSFRPTYTSKSTAASGSLAAKWRMNQVLDIPFDLAMRPHVAMSEVEWDQFVDGASSKVKIKHSQINYGLDFIFSRNYGPLSPYGSIGLAVSDGEIESDTGSIFDSSFSSSSKEDATVFGGAFAAGVTANFAWLNFGVEVSNTFNSYATTFKSTVVF